MAIQIMATEQGDQLVERIVQAAVLLHTEMGATQDEAAKFIDKNLSLLGDSSDFIEASSGHVYVAAVRRFRNLVDEALAEEVDRA